MDDIFAEDENIRLDLISPDNMAKNNGKLQELTTGDKIFRVQSDVDTIRAIISIFNIFNINKPQNWNVLICTPSTVIS